MIARHDHDAPGVPGGAEKRGHLPQTLRRPGEVELVAPLQLRVDGVVDNSNDPLLGFAYRMLHRRVELRSRAKVSLMEKQGRPTGARRRVLARGCETGFLLGLIAARQSAAHQARSRDLGNRWHRRRGDKRSRALRLRQRGPPELAYRLGEDVPNGKTQSI